MQKAKLKPWKKSPPFYLATGFFVMILVGTALLMSPISSRAGVVTPFVDALFTATSATCVTGLVVYTTIEYWSAFGQAVILFLIQIGGLGFMTMTVLIALLLDRKVTLSDRLVIKEQFGKDSLTGIVRWMRYIILFTLAMEGIGAILLSTQFVPIYGWRTGIWYGIFHGISAFCNAGFDLLGRASLIPFQTNPLLIFTISALVVIGGIGFGVYLDLFRRESRQLSLHTKLVLSMTAFLLLAGTLLFLFIERGNPETAGHMSTANQWMTAFFQSVTTRTAGFFSVSQESLHEVSAVLSIFLMFIGGSPAGTAGGIKTTTIAVLLLATLSQLRGQSHTSAFHRSISSEIVKRALTIIMVGLLWVVSVSFIIAVVERAEYITALFETVSAFGTVGLSLDFTSGLTTVSKILLALTMYAGRVGPVTLGFALISRRKSSSLMNPEGNVMVG